MEAISPARFAFVFERFLEAVALYSPLDGPFTNFQMGLAGKWENYKDWLYLEARRRLKVSAWKKDRIGTGEILRHVIEAIQIREDQDHRNNIVEWQQKYKESDRSHHRMVLAQRSAQLRKVAETALFHMYADKANAENCFGELAEIFGARYDLISYLFFLRDWNEFLPLRPNAFETAFKMLGVPLKMVKQCSWENYSEYLSRIQQVRALLARYDIPNGVRLIDAHSFCWMLASRQINVSLRDRRAVFVTFTPRAGEPPTHKLTERKFSQHDLDELLIAQRRIGNSAQMYVLREEQDRLRRAGRADLADRIKDVSDNFSLGYDIASFTSAGQPKPIEVKAAARRGGDVRFFLSEHERRVSEKTEGYTFALVVHHDKRRPVIAEFLGKDLPPEAAHPVAYEFRLKAPPLPTR
jgi:hypothetical protein